MNEGDKVTDKENLNVNEAEELDEVTEANAGEKNSAAENEAVVELQRKLEEKEKECSEYLELARRTKAEFDNFRKRTQKEKESLYGDGIGDAVKELLPVLDNLERALAYNEAEEKSLYDGLEMVLKSFYDILGKIGVEEIEADGVEFNPDFHNAVMHVEDPELGENTVAEVLQKGFRLKDKIIRYSMVKVAN